MCLGIANDECDTENTIFGNTPCLFTSQWYGICIGLVLVPLTTETVLPSFETVTLWLSDVLWICSLLLCIVIIFHDFMREVGRGRHSKLVIKRHGHYSLQDTRNVTFALCRIYRYHVSHLAVSSIPSLFFRLCVLRSPQRGPSALKTWTRRCSIWRDWWKIWMP